MSSEIDGRCVCKQPGGDVSRTRVRPLVMTRVAVAAANIVVKSPHDSVHAELLERLSPFFPTAIINTWEYRQLLDAERVHTIHAETAARRNPPDSGQKLSVRPADSLSSENWATVAFADSIYELFLHRTGSSARFAPGNRQICLSNPEELALAKEVRRSIQDIGRLHIRSEGGRFIEAAAIRLPDGRGVVIPGRSGAGKTTLLIRLLDITGGDFIANDEVILESSVDEVFVTGSPIHVAIKDFTANRHVAFSDLRERMAVEAVPKIAMSHAEFARRLSCGVSRTAPIAVVLVPGRDVAGDRHSDFDLDHYEEWGCGWSTPWRHYLGVTAVPAGIPREVKRRIPRPAPVSWDLTDDQLLSLLDAGSASEQAGGPR